MACRTRRPSTMQAVGYLRMSTTKQGLSLDAQRLVIETWAEKEGVEVVAWHEDPARSGSTHPKRRQGLQAAIRDVEDRRAGLLVVAAEDRLTRHVDHAGWIATELADLGAKVVDAAHPERDWLGRMFARLQAQGYLESLKANTTRALRLKKARGEKTGGEAPFGYRAVEVDGVKRLEPNPDEWPAVERIRELRAQGMGGRRIAAALTAEGFRPRGASWDPGAVQRFADRLLAEAPPAPKPDLPGLVLAALQSAPRTASGMVELHSLVRGLMGKGHALEAIHGGLRELARREALELRVESGLQRLTPEELALLPEGLRGSRLSLARLQLTR